MQLLLFGRESAKFKSEIINLSFWGGTMKNLKSEGFEKRALRARFLDKLGMTECWDCVL